MSDPSELQIAPEATLGEAVTRLRDLGGQLLAVVDARGRVQGTVTEAHIRRAAVADPDLRRPVAVAMSPAAIAVQPSTPDAEVLDLLTTLRLSAVAVVEGDRLVGVRSLADFPGAAPPAPVAVVMVGGLGERLRPLTDKVPKPLLRVGGQPIVERVIRSLAAAGITDVTLAVNYMAELFEDHLGDGTRLGVTIRYVREEQPMGTAGALSLLPAVPDVPVVVTNGDLITTIDFGAMVAYHRHQAAAITVAGVEHRTPVPYGVLRTTEHHLLGIDEKPDRVDLVNAGLYVLEPEVFRLIPSRAPMGMPELIAVALAEGLTVGVFPAVLERWIDIGTPEEFERVLHLFATGEEE